MSHPIPDREIEQIVSLYSLGQSARSIGRLFGCTTRTVTNWLKCAGVTLRSPSEACRVHSLNQNIFASVETEPQAYWLGFLSADGGINLHHSVRVNLQERDSGHLELLQAFFQTTKPIQCQMCRCKSGTYPVSYLIVTSEQICSDLARYGVLPKKSKTIRWPDGLPPQLASHYVRGVFDGDGTWCGMNRKGMCQWRLIGNRAYLLDIQSLMMETCCLNQTKLCDHHTTPDMAYLVYNGTRQTMRIADWLYRDATVWLPRKANVLVEYLRRHDYSQDGCSAFSAAVSGQGAICSHYKKGYMYQATCHRPAPNRSSEVEGR
jgi:hypothetical protein